MQNCNIAIDMMGGDFAPLEAVKGIKSFLQSNPNIFIQAIGDSELLQQLFATYSIASSQVTIVPSTETISYHESPVRALKEKPNSSISIGFQLLATKKTDAFISAGNTGAMMVGAMHIIKPVAGVLRPTIPTIIPKPHNKKGILLDVGLNADCKPEYLVQFAQLGSLYAQHILNIHNPKVGLINVGEEEGKGNMLAQAAYPLLKENNQINFIGNIEGRDFFGSKADVMVCDGFTGNIILKMAESIYDIAKQEQVHKQGYFSQFNYETYGGTAILGIAQPVIIGHGISGEIAFANMLAVAQQMVTTQLCSTIVHSFQQL